MKIKKILSAILLLVLVIVTMAGCLKSNDTIQEKETENAGKGRYIEEAVTFPEELKSVFDMKKLDDGNLVLAADTLKDSLVYYSSKDEGNTWTKSQTIGSDQIPKGKRIVAAAVNSQGDLYISYAEPMDKEHLDTITAFTGDMKYLKIDKDGKAGELKLDLPDFPKDGDFAVGLYQLDIDSKNMLYGSEIGGAVYQLNTDTGKLIHTYPSEGAIRKFFAVFDKLLIVDGEKVKLYNSDGSEPEDLDILSDYFTEDKNSGENYLITEGSKENEIYFCNKKGVYHYTFGGNIVEQLVDGSLNNLSAANVFYLSLLQKKDGNFMILYNDSINQKYALMNYAYDAKLPSVPTDELRIYSLRESDTIQSMVTAFQKANQDIHVIYETGITGNDAVSETDAIKTLNTEMMAGNGPDILALDHMPVDSYMEKGMLYDMSELLQDVEKNNDLFTNIVNGYAQNGKIYAAPIRFKIPVICGNDELVSKVTDMESLAQTAQTYFAENPEGLYLNYSFADGLFQRLFSVYYQDCFNEDGSIKEDNLKQFLINFKNINDAALKNIPQKQREQYKEKRDMWEKSDQYVNYVDMDEDIYFNNSESTEGDTALNMGFLAYDRDFSDYSMMKDKYPGYTLQLANSTSKFFKPESIVGINSKSKNTENAKKFIEFLYQETTQEIKNYDGYPVNRTAFLKAQETPSDSMMSDLNMGRTTPYRWASKDEFKSLNQLVESLNTPTFTNRIVVDMIYENAEKYINRSGTIDEAMDQIMQKLNLYLSE